MYLSMSAQYHHHQTSDHHQNRVISHIESLERANNVTVTALSESTDVDVILDVEKCHLDGVESPVCHSCFKQDL